YWGTDVGGYYPTVEASAELFVRWFQFGAFCPIFRAHGRAWRERLPWTYGSEIEDICRRYLELRYRLLPYTYTLACEAHRSGPPARSVTLLTYPAANELVASCTLYDDDGTTNGYRQGDYSLTGFECSATAGALVCRIGATRGAAVPEGRTYAFQILAPAVPRR